MATLDYLVKRAFLVVRFAQYVTHICTTITNRRFSIVYGPKSEKKEATVHINPLLGGFLLVVVVVLFLSRSEELSTGKMLRLREEEKLLEMMLHIYC